MHILYSSLIHSTYLSHRYQLCTLYIPGTVLSQWDFRMKRIVEDICPLELGSYILCIPILTSLRNLNLPTLFCVFKLLYSIQRVKNSSPWRKIPSQSFTPLRSLFLLPHICLWIYHLKSLLLI